MTTRITQGYMVLPENLHPSGENNEEYPNNEKINSKTKSYTQNSCLSIFILIHSK